jgi:hypothetical protein
MGGGCHTSSSWVSTPLGLQRGLQFLKVQCEVHYFIFS